MSTLADVARQAGVGIGTVSRVLNHHPGVSAKMRVRVEAAMDDVGYNRTARATGAARLGQVGVLVPFFDEPSAYERLGGIVARLAPHDMNIVLYNVSAPGQIGACINRLVQLKQLAALIVISLPLSDSDAALLTSAPYPAVLLDTAHPRLASVGVDDRLGGRLATQHLLDLGHRRIGFVGEPQHNVFGFVSSPRRQAGYEAALAQAGIAIDATLIRHGAHLASAAKQMAINLLQMRRPPTAVVVASDVQSVGVLEAAEQLGVTVPADLSVVGYDDIEIARLLGLTTVRQPLERSGRRAADLVLSAINGGPVGSIGEQLDLELVVRSTTGPRS